MNGLEACVGPVMGTGREALGSAPFSHATFCLFKEFLVAYTKFIDVDFSVCIKSSAIRFAFVRGS